MVLEAVPPARTEAPEPHEQRVIVLAMHGAPPLDFPRTDLAELMSLHLRPAPEPERMRALDRRIRAWPRSPDNDPYWWGSRQLASALRHEAGCPVVVGFNEFCDPSIDEAIAYGVSLRPPEVLVITPMLTRGGTHAEVGIAEAVTRARAAWPTVPIRHVWPVEVGTAARFLAHLARLWSEVT